MSEAQPHPKVRLDMQDLTLGELAEAAEMLGTDLQTAVTGPGQPRAIAALAYIVMRRTDPTFTFEQALKLRMGDLEMVNAPDAGEQSGGNNGAEPALLPASGG